MIEERSVAFAEEIQSELPARRVDEPILGTFSVADKPNFAIQTILRQCGGFCPRERMLAIAVDEFGHRRFEDVAEFMLRFDEVIAAIQISVVLHRHRAAAVFLEDA